MMTETEIKRYLQEKYCDNGNCNREWAYFENFRNATGYVSNVVRYADAIVVGLWERNSGIIVYEIKSSRSDFINDVKQFGDKHREALRVCTQFYYICDHGLIQPDEVPEIAGLQWVSSSGRISTKKVAMQTPLKDIPFSMFRSFARQSGMVVNYGDVPLKFLDKEISQKEFRDMVDKEVLKITANTIEKKVREEIQRRELLCEKKIREHTDFMLALKRICGGGYYTEDWDSQENYDVALKVVREAKESINIDKMIEDAVNDIERAVSILKNVG